MEQSELVMTILAVQGPPLSDDMPVILTISTSRDGNAASRSPSFHTQRHLRRKIAVP